MSPPYSGSKKNARNQRESWLCRLLSHCFLTHYYSILKMEATCSPETSLTFNGLRGIISQKIEELFSFTIVFKLDIFLRMYTHSHAHICYGTVLSSDTNPSYCGLWEDWRIYLSDLMTWTVHGKFRHDSGTFVLLLSPILRLALVWYLFTWTLHICLELFTLGRWHCDGFVQVTFMLPSAMRKKHLSPLYVMLWNAVECCILLLIC
jgi:hypothetical protein